MSWLARSIANSLLIDDEEAPSPAPESSQENADVEERDGGENHDPRRKMRDDLTEFRQSLSRQFRDVANFLAPSPLVPHDRVASESTLPVSPGSDDDDNSSVYARISTARSDHSEGLDNRAVLKSYAGCSSFNNRVGFGNIVYVANDGDENDDDDDVDVDVDNGGDGDGDDEEEWVNEAAGLTDEVLAFAGNIAHHPETWLDFPIEDDEDMDDFPMSESQKRHAQAVEHLTPRLAALRIELCPVHMSIGFFWKVYFVLLLSRLNKQDAELLSTPEVAEARAKWMQELQERAKKESEGYHVGHYSRPSADLDDDFTPRSQQNEHSETLSSWTFASDPTTSSTTAEADSDSEKQLVSTEMKFTNKPSVEEKFLADADDKNDVSASVPKRFVLNFDDDDDDDWPEDDWLGNNVTVIPVGLDEEVSFSDLEDDCCVPVKSKSDRG